ncbi:FMN reductase (NADH) RutF [Paraburkholderia terrae]|uniref:FMN reductase (NADH) RutF n=1 Tax=Paraburkholderia terrae TaxID=311230 RepID=A0ABM7TRQ7_9BURK|nr:flavin reductase [Paraburkholderia terrae]BCZ81308.1 FMN reductase (NADH) RutF [Paraburkholderia terrae]
MTQAQVQPADAIAHPRHEQADDLPDIDATAFREALAHAATSVTVIATDGPAGKAGVTCSAVCSVSDTPPTILFCVNRRSAANSVIRTNGLLSVNWLHAQQTGISQLFSGVGQVPMRERFNDARWQASAHGVPYRTDALIALDCRIASAMEIGTHSVFVARVLNARRADGMQPLVYCQRAYATTRPAQF